MKKQTKILLSILGVVVVGALVFTATNSGVFQGKIFKENCTPILANFDPNSGAIAKYGDKTDFKWNGHGCSNSNYTWTQYELCFQNVANAGEFACFGGDYHNGENRRILSGADWRWINENMKTSSSNNQIDTYWYVQSRFGDNIHGEILKSGRWKFSYTK